MATERFAKSKVRLARIRALTGARTVARRRKMIVTAATGVQQDLATVTPREVATVTAAATIATATARSADRGLAIS